MKPIIKIKSASELRQLKLEQEQQYRKMEEAEKKSIAERKLQEIFDSQNNINNLAEKTTTIYYSIVGEPKKQRLRSEKKLKEKEEEYKLFLETQSLAYPFQEFDEKTNSIMKVRMWAYILLPIADVIFAFFAIHPLVKSKLISNEIDSSFISILSAVLVGTLLTLIGRFGRSCERDDDKLRYLASGLIPIMYVTYLFAFSDLSLVDIAYVSGFLLVSIYIQYRIIKDFSKHIDALAFIKDKKNNKKIKEKRDEHNRKLNEEVNNLIEEIERQTLDFINKFNLDFGSAFRELALARRSHFNNYLVEPSILINQLIVYIGDVAFFRYEEIPFKRTEDGRVKMLHVTDFPNVQSCHEIHKSDELTFIVYMLQYAGTGRMLSDVLNHNSIN